ncbi:hypothetical protein KDH_18810 [Dictyobacter sp. S3.2.2.5]|uniref:Uncharacterized protein n=1 Tax=Dictyobacter halimunensis TaxID=3026934 RepID=A0ABQ6FPT3_9CHLR|nr:hypothetical protein KDH_18810 [Dictyobacter sp. S3.2.2.5]
MGNPKNKYNVVSNFLNNYVTISSTDENAPDGNKHKEMFTNGVTRSGAAVNAHERWVAYLYP